MAAGKRLGMVKNAARRAVAVDHATSARRTACSFHWFIVLKALFAGLL
jgi:hypothetical protein